MYIFQLHVPNPHLTWLDYNNNTNIIAYNNKKKTFCKLPEMYLLFPISCAKHLTSHDFSAFYDLRRWNPYLYYKT